MRKTLLVSLSSGMKLVQKFLLLCVVGICLISGVMAQKSADKTLYDTDGFAIVQPNISTTKKTVSDTDPFVMTQISISAADVKEGVLASCFDYYAFGSIDVDLSTNMSSYKSGDPVIVTGALKNKNRYPVVGLDIRGRIVKNIPNPISTRSEIIILDDLDIAKNITLDAQGVFQVSYTYILPLNAPAGDYQILFYAVEQDRFNLSGLSFTNDIIASKVVFSVEGKQPDHIYLDQTQILVGDQPHNVMAFMTQHASGKPIPVTIPLANPSSTAKKMRVTYDLYAWDAANPTNKISTRSEDVVVPARASYELTYMIDAATLPVYYLTITAEPVGTLKDASIFSEKTISHIRLMVNGVSRPRLNFIGVDTYPLQAGKEATLVTCFHNTSGETDSRITKIETILYDQNKKELSRIVYEGKIIPDISGLIHKFTPSKESSQFTIVSKMSDAQGTVLDTVEKIYTCQDINPQICPPTQPVSPPASHLPSSIVLVIGGILFLLLIGLGIVLYRRKNRNTLNT